MVFLFPCCHDYARHLTLYDIFCMSSEHDNVNEDDDDNREQDRLAKYFEKRARRNRILEEFEGDTQFSRSRLIDEDVSMQQDLKTMKVIMHCL